jgi:signal peptidase II
VNLALLCAAAGVAAGLDQATKHLAARRLAAPDGQGPVVGLRLVRTPRPGILKLGDRAAVALWLAAVAMLVVALAVLAGAQAAPGLAIGLGLAVGGAGSNLGDRLVRGCVVDFIAVWRWPTFNLADAAIVTGAVLVVASLP